MVCVYREGRAIERQVLSQPIFLAKQFFMPESDKPAIDDEERATPPQDDSAAALARTEPELGDPPAVDEAGAVTEAGGAAQVPVRAAARRPRKPELEMLAWHHAKKPGWLRRHKLFILFTAIPTLISAIYFGLVATDVYISESRFVVRTPQRTQAPSFMGALLQGSSFSRAQDDSFTVHDYIQSRDALRELEKKHELKASFSSAQIDPLNRFPGPLSDDSFESFYKYYTRHVTVEFDTASSITTLRVRTFDPKQSFQINSTLLGLSEKLVNQINGRGRLDMVQYAVAELAEAEAKAKTAALAVANYRNERRIFDPERQSTLQLQQISKLQDELISTKMQLAQIRALSPENPQISSLENRASGLQSSIAAEMAKVAGSSGDSFSNKAAEFERLVLERTFAERQVASALASLESARNDARRQQLYLERIVQPNLPDEALEPRRLRNIFATFLLGLIGWGIASMLLSGVKEHQA